MSVDERFRIRLTADSWPDDSERTCWSACFDVQGKRMDWVPHTDATGKTPELALWNLAEALGSALLNAQDFVGGEKNEGQ